MPKQKVNLSEHISTLVDEVRKVENSDLEQREKTIKFKAAATHFKNAIYNDKRKFSGPAGQKRQISVNTYNTYLSRARRKIEELGFRHHLLDRELSRLKKRYPQHQKLIAELESLDPTAARLKKKEIEELLHKAEGLRVAMLKIDYSHPSAKKQIGTLQERHPYYNDLLANLLGPDAQEAGEEMGRAMDEITPLIGDLMGLKVNHEIMYSLAMDKATRAKHTVAQDSQLSKKKKLAVVVNYQNYIQRIYSLLTNPTHSVADTTTFGMAPLCFAIAAATGRRPIEVLDQGGFEAVDAHRLKFTGQAKKRDSSDEAERIIYSLVDTKIIIKAIDIFRKLPAVVELNELVESDHRSVNVLINQRTATPLNAYAKEFFNDKERVFKDTRAIYARICHERWFNTDPRWTKCDEDVFFAELLGHEDEQTQMHYKQFKTSGLREDFKPAESDRVNRLEKMAAFDGEMQTLANGDAAVRLHKIVKDMLEKDPDIKITQSLISKASGSKRTMIQRYMDLCADALGIEKRDNGRWYQKDQAELEVLTKVEVDDDEVITLESDQEADDAAELVAESEGPAVEERAAPVPKITPKPTPAKKKERAAKPKIGAFKNDDGTWTGEVELGDKTVAMANAETMSEAQRLAWRHYEDDQAVITSKKEGDWWHVTIMVGNIIMEEIMQKGREGLAKKAAWAAFHKRN